MTDAAAHNSSPSAGDGLRGLLLAFKLQNELKRFTEVPARNVPPPYDRLLRHDGHMTVTLEQYHGAPIHLKVLAVQHTDHLYTRKITLHARPDGPPVLLGVMQFNFHYCSARTRDEIVAGSTPLGRILIAHDVLCHLTAGPYYCVASGSSAVLGLEVDLPPDCHARLAHINCNGGRAVQVLEIITSVRPAHEW